MKVRTVKSTGDLVRTLLGYMQGTFLLSRGKRFPANFVIFHFLGALSKNFPRERLFSRSECFNPGINPNRPSFSAHRYPCSRSEFIYTVAMSTEVKEKKKVCYKMGIVL